MQITGLQMFIFCQSLVTKIKFPDMELTRVAPAFRTQYKKARGMKLKATALEVLRDVRQVCNENEMLQEFIRATAKYPQIVEQLNAPFLKAA